MTASGLAACRTLWGRFGRPCMEQPWQRTQDQLTPIYLYAIQLAFLAFPSVTACQVKARNMPPRKAARASPAHNHLILSCFWKQTGPNPLPQKPPSVALPGRAASAAIFQSEQIMSLWRGNVPEMFSVLSTQPGNKRPPFHIIITSVPRDTCTGNSELSRQRPDIQVSDPLGV